MEKVKKEEVTSSLGQRINTAQSEINLALWEEGVQWSKPAGLSEWLEKAELMAGVWSPQGLPCSHQLLMCCE